MLAVLVRACMQAAQSPLAVAVAAGAIALPALLKLAALFEKQLSTDLHTCEQLPVEVELGPEFVFHSIFACPVSRDQSTSDNPPVLLPCNHVLCEQSVLKIAKSRARSFKCPYCPTEVSAAARQRMQGRSAEQGSCRSCGGDWKHA